jgi:hypothetical protein
MSSWRVPWSVESPALPYIAHHSKFLLDIVTLIGPAGLSL